MASDPVSGAVAFGAGLLSFFAPCVLPVIPGYLAFVAIVSLGGLWLERYLLVVPSAWQGEGVPLGWIELGVSVGFLGLFALSYLAYSSTFPKMPIREVLSAGEASTGP